MSRVVLRNFASLSILHAANYAVPLVTVPYLTRTLGAAGFGDLAIAQAITQYLVILVDFGFNLSSARLIALHSSEPDKLSAIFWSTLLAKGMLVGASVVILCLCSFLPGLAHMRSAIWANSLAAVLGTWLFPSWLFQGLNRMTTISLINLLARVSSVPLVFLYVKSIHDLNVAAAALGLPALLAGVIGLTAALKLGVGRARRTGMPLVLERLTEGWPLFLSVAGASLYSASNVILLRLVAPPQVVGYFAGADKIRVAVVGLIPQMTSAFFPTAVSAPNRSGGRLIQEFRPYWIQIALGASIFLFLFASAGVIVPLALGNSMAPSIPILRMLAFLGLVIPFNHILGVSVLVARGFSKPFSRALLAGGATNFILLPLLAARFGVMGAAAALILVEGVVLAGLVTAYRGINPTKVVTVES
jgi:O-antigen/teichoic acid export membrane protein